ncbi:MAG: GtrA family protein, partial [Lachnospiraceae bacterium]|nr:GtrA family protein [Lachnospiraceae bacterium]
MAKVKNKEAARAIKFALFSASAGIIEFVSIALLDAATPWRHFYCYLIGLVLSVLWNFTLNRRYTFKSANNVPVAMLKVACFYAVFTPLSTWLDKVLTE